MCGIFGIVNLSQRKEIDSERFKDSAMLMKHRGPDAYDQWGISGKIKMAHLRLAIIDLSEGSNQPFQSLCKNFTIVFNGEIYNYLELRKELELLGHEFKTSSDTEVLLNSYIQWGEGCTQKFNGMWAFAIFNSKNDSLFCSRDRFGIKPFCYSITEDSLIFSSEIKSILNFFPHLRVPNYNIISNYCRNSLGAQAEQTWFDGIVRLMPGHNLTIKDGEISIYRYWEYPSKTIDISIEEAKKEYKRLFIDAVKLRMRSDVPVGTTLSSGLDSSSIVSVLRKFYGEDHKTFTAVFPKKDFQKEETSVYASNIEINEGDLVRRLAKDLALDAYLLEISNDDFVEELSNLIYHLESGHSSPAILPLSKVQEYAKEHVTVLMEGQGADELLSGYIINTFPALLWENLKRLRFKSIIKEIKAFKVQYSIVYSFKMYLRQMNNCLIESIYLSWSGTNAMFGPKLKKFKRVKDYPLRGPNFDQKFNFDLFKSHSGGLVNLLHYGDAISMRHSLESRNPFMDVNLVEFAFRLPYNLKMHDGLGKYIHRKSMDGIVPNYILNNSLKFGFNTPLGKFFSDYESVALKILLSERCLSRGLFSVKGLKKIIDQHISQKSNHSTILFRLLSVELWFREFIDVKKIQSRSTN